jgi:hypothetical protein
VRNRNSNSNSSGSSTSNSGKDGSGKLVVVRLSSWRLAGRSTVTCILNEKSVQVVRHQKLYEMNTHERVEWAHQLKTTAGEQFAKKDYIAALQSYTRAVDALRYITETTNSNSTRSVPPEIRADLVMLLITCNNNAATCCWNLTSHQQHRDDDSATKSTTTASADATTTTTTTDTVQRRQRQQQSQPQQQSLLYAERTLKYARDALVLLEALEKNQGQRIHQQLVNKDGYSDIKLFGEMKVKSLLLQARALMQQYETVQALESLTMAHDIIAHYTSAAFYDSSSSKSSKSKSIQASIKSLHASSKEVKKLHQTCRERRIQEKQKEKLRAQAMFAGSSFSTSYSSPSVPIAEKKIGISTSPPSSPTNAMQYPQQQEQEDNDDHGESSSSSSMGYEAMTTRNHQDNGGNGSHNNDATAMKQQNVNVQPRRVSFSEKVIYKTEEMDGSDEAEYEVHPLRPPAISPKKKKMSSTNVGNNNNNKSRIKAANGNSTNNEMDDELEWHQDPEVVTGLFIFAGTIALTALSTWYLLSGKRSA